MRLWKTNDENKYMYQDISFDKEVIEYLGIFFTKNKNKSLEQNFKNKPTGNGTSDVSSTNKR